MELEGAIILVPTLVVFVLAILSHRPIESLITGSVVGLVMIHGTGFVGGFAEASIRVMTDDDVSAQFGETVRPGQLVGVRIELVLQPPVQGEDHKVTGFASIKRNWLNPLTAIILFPLLGIKRKL